MKRLSSRHMPRLVTEIQVTPLMDLLLLLLLSVVVVAVMQEMEGRGDADSTSAAVKMASTPTAPENTITLMVSADLELTLGGVRIEQKALIPELKKRIAQEPELGVIVHVAESLTTPRLLEIMAALRTASVRHTAVQTERKAQP